MVEMKVWGSYACFSRPEFKVERVSYPLITPSAARGVLEAVYWKPEFRFEIREIVVLKPVKQMVIVRNEISDRQGETPLLVDDSRQRQQRTSLILKDVAYIVRAAVVTRPHADHPPTKYIECFQRRLDRGQCRYRPYLGTREFAACVEPPDGKEEPCVEHVEPGNMLFEIAYVESIERPELTFHRHDANGARTVTGFAEPLYFDATSCYSAGILRIPRQKYRELHAKEAAIA